MASVIEPTAASERPTRVRVAPVRLTYVLITATPKKKVAKASKTVAEVHKSRTSKPAAKKAAVKTKKIAGSKAIVVKSKSKAKAKAKGAKSNESGRYEVEKIHDMDVDDDGKDIFLVKWVGYTKKTWEPEENLKNVKNLIEKLKKERATKA